MKPRAGQGKRIGSYNNLSSNNVIDDISSCPARALTQDLVNRLLNLLGNNPSKTVNSGNSSDSGENHHMVTSDNNLTNIINVSEFNIRVKHPNGTSAKVTKIGDVKLNDRVTLKDVFVIPDYCVNVNLMSVYKLAKDSNMIVSFDERTPSSVLGGKSPYELVLDNKTIVFSRDVKFYEKVFPFKESVSRLEIDTFVPTSLNELNFFDLYENTDANITSIDPAPDDEIRAVNTNDIHPHGSQQPGNENVTSTGTFMCDTILVIVKPYVSGYIEG
ncbi:hypothetical protein SSX86_011589 [Deinandra increscens subsp. villosa]|uniref:Retrovirus-related Pol polyprotein from transposon TNT 1-94-like beta-barrel domain-containing protein n=1 Tax=Deinandra increscens subsp. villosa TaxID=3103831 RepID=A0AAP0D6U4_9ASTR